MSEAWRIVRKLTWHKILNHAKLQISYRWSSLTGKVWHWGKPESLSIEPTTSCNLHCPECPSGLRQFTRPTGNMDFEFYSQVIEQSYKHLSFLLLYFQGEPYLNPRFFDMVRYAAQRGVYTATSTNGHFLNPERARQTVECGLHRLVVSVDGATQETYSVYRKGGNLQKVLDGVDNLVAAKKELHSTTPYIIFQCLIVKDNQHEINALRRIALEHGADEVVFKTAQVYNYHHGNPLIPTIEQFSRYKALPDGTFEPKNTHIKSCWRMWHSAVVTWDGRVAPCCFDKDATHNMGNVKNMPLLQIWNSSPYKMFRQQVLSSRNNIDICTNCTEGMKVVFSET